MGKIAFLIVNFLFLISYNIYFGGEVTVEQKLPSSVAAGEKFVIEVEINKGDREGFAKWQEELPKGFIATPIETQGATFSFKKQNVKLIWMALPEEESFTVSYEVIPDVSIQGTYTFEGKFSYIENNERKDISSTSYSIAIGNGDLVAETNAVEEITEENETTSDENVASTESQEMEMEEPIASLEVAEISNEDDTDIESNNNESIQNGKEEIISQNRVTNSEGIVIERTIINLNEGNYKVLLKVNKGSNQSFGKIEEYVPPGYIAMEDESNEGIYSFNNNVMKILWMTLPANNEINISYLMKSESDELDSATVHGVFSILIEDESYQLAMGPSRFKNYFLMEEQIVEEVQEEIADVPEAKEIEVEESKEEMIEEITNIPSAETGITYKVQIAAGKIEVKQDYFVKRHNINESVSTEYHNSWFKYTLGSFMVYKDARDKRNSIWEADNKINDAFVTAYNSGDRISVQEALMISKQNWVK